MRKQQGIRNFISNFESNFNASIIKKLLETLEYKICEYFYVARFIPSFGQYFLMQLITVHEIKTKRC